MEDNIKAERGEEVRGKIFKCPSCGNVLRFDPKTKMLQCPYCSHTETLRHVKDAREIGYTVISEMNYEPWGERKCFRCSNCGAIVTLGEYETATACPFCRTSVIIETEDIVGLKPNSILPFCLDAAAAEEKYRAWAKKKVFAPGKIKKNFKASDMKGMYIPCWTYDACANADYEGRLGEHYTVTVGTGKNRRVETRTRWYYVSGRYSESYDDIVVEASKYIDSKDLRKLGGYDTVNALEYDEQYMSGYYAERYSLGLDAGWKKACDHMYNDLRSQILAQYHADVVDYLDIAPNYYNVTYKYVLVPLYLCSFKYNKKDYGLMVNGRNGKVIGKMPLSPLRVGLTALAIGIAAVIIYLLVRFL